MLKQQRQQYNTMKPIEIIVAAVVKRSDLFLEHLYEHVFKACFGSSLFVFWQRSLPPHGIICVTAPFGSISGRMPFLAEGKIAGQHLSVYDLDQLLFFAASYWNVNILSF